MYYSAASRKKLEGLVSTIEQAEQLGSVFSYHCICALYVVHSRISVWNEEPSYFMLTIVCSLLFASVICAVILFDAQRSLKKMFG